MKKKEKIGKLKKKSNFEKKIYKRKKNENKKKKRKKLVKKINTVNYCCNL
jgi:hypothetical protein